MTSIFNSDLYVGKTVLITGGGSGIGFSLARTFGQLGAHVVIAARDEDKLQQAVSRLSNEGIKVSYGVVNIREEESVHQLFSRLAKSGITFDVLINNAGGQFAARALDISANGFRSVVDLNLQGTFQMSKAFCEQCIEQGRQGNIVNIVLCQESGLPGMAHAAAARAGVVNLTKTLAWEWAEHGLRVNAIAPGTIKTDALGQYDAEVLQESIDQLLIKRMGTPEEVSHSVAFLASDAASFITGVCLAQDGGEHLTGATVQCE